MKWVRIARDNGFLPTNLVERDPMFNEIRSDDEFREIIEIQKKKEAASEPRLDAMRKKIREMEQS